jgi:hypothetical protein
MLALGILVVPVAAAVLTAPGAAHASVASGDLVFLKPSVGIYKFQASDSSITQIDGDTSDDAPDVLRMEAKSCSCVATVTSS